MPWKKYVAAKLFRLTRNSCGGGKLKKNLTGPFAVIFEVKGTSFKINQGLDGSWVF